MKTLYDPNKLLLISKLNRGDIILSGTQIVEAKGCRHGDALIGHAVSFNEFKAFLLSRGHTSPYIEEIKLISAELSDSKAKKKAERKVAQLKSVRRGVQKVYNDIASDPRSTKQQDDIALLAKAIGMLMDDKT